MSSIWSTYTASPHRMMFLPGALQGVLVMVWWLIDIAIRRAGGDGLGPLPGPALHVWWMLYGFLPFFIFGFLFTAAPNWLSGPAIPKPAYVASALLMTLGLPLVYAGQISVGLALHLAGWCVGVGALVRTLMRAPQGDRQHAGIAILAVAAGCVGDALFLVWARGDVLDSLHLAEVIGLWGFLVPTYLTVCHRMIPWFTSRIIPDYVMVRPDLPFWGLLLGCLVHGVLEWMQRRELLWLVDLPMASAAFWFSARWGVVRGMRQVRLLAMLHLAYLWAGLAFALYAIDSLARFTGQEWNAGQAPLHALGIGFFSSMVIAMASRVSLGHSGRMLEADGYTWGLYWLLQAVALLRMLPELLSGLPQDSISLAGGLWLLVFGLWAAKYAPMYWRPRADGKAG